MTFRAWVHIAKPYPSVPTQRRKEESFAPEDRRLDLRLQSLPLSRLANRIVTAVPGLTGGGKGEGSILGGLGGLLDGDSR